MTYNIYVETLQCGGKNHALPEKRVLPIVFIQLKKPMDFTTILQTLNFPTLLKPIGKKVGV